MDLRQWCLEFGISQEFNADEAVELIKAYESLYVPIHGRAIIEQLGIVERMDKALSPTAPQKEQ